MSYTKEDTEVKRGKGEDLGLRRSQCRAEVWISESFGVVFLPFLSIVQVGTVPFPYPEPGHITKAQRLLGSQSMLHTVNPCRGQEGWGDLQTQRLRIDKAASPFFRENMEILLILIL